MAASKGFFERRSLQSEVKSLIVSKYFDAWANVMIAAQKRYPRRSTGSIAYVDLFAGPGRYEDGEASTPLLVLQKAIQKEEFRQRLVAVFNDKDQDNCRTLRQEIKRLSAIHSLRFQPTVRNLVVGEDVIKVFEEIRSVPTLSFLDPWGYKGLSLRLIESAVRGWGCDCIFFFNYNRVNMNLGLANAAVRESIDEIFGQQRGRRLRERLEPLSAHEREATILEELCDAIKELSPEYVLPFCFKNEQGTRTSHHLVFVSKHFLGYEIMKGIMARESSIKDQGVPSFQYCPADQRQPLLFELSRPLNDLKEMLPREFAGQSLKMIEIYKRHNVGRPYIEKNYREVLTELEEEGKISSSEHRPGTFPGHVVVTFPPRNR